jgi:hypothetical protein
MKMPITLVGDGIENPFNARVMQAAAALFGGPCCFRDRAGLAAAWSADLPDAEPPDLLTSEDLAAQAPLIALDNVPGAQPVYGFRPPRGPRPALMAGNERQGIARDALKLASHKVMIPMAGHRLNTINVAAASAVALYYLNRDGGGPLQVTPQPQKRRPELLLLGAADHVEAGSSIRSAGAFGWERVLVEDRSGVWFGAPRHVTAEGRGAARRHRNPIRLIPAGPAASYAFAEVWVVTRNQGDVPLHRANLAAGPRSLLVIPDEEAIDLDAEPWDRLGARVRFAHLGLPERSHCPYRLHASIALAEAARQVGQRERLPGRPPRAEPLYDRALTVLAAEAGETVDLEELGAY